MTKKRPQQKGKTRKPKDGSEDDIIIPVMGPTGVGKSTFINIAAGQDRTLVGHDLTSCTAEIQVVRVTHPRFPSRRIVFVDTPGFDDTYVSDTEILRRIANWLKDTYTDDKKTVWYHLPARHFPGSHAGLPAAQFPDVQQAVRQRSCEKRHSRDNQMGPGGKANRRVPRTTARKQLLARDPTSRIEKSSVPGKQRLCMANR